MKRLIIVASLTLLLTACVTSYRPENIASPEAGGYSDKKLNDGLYEVRFRGNRNTSKIAVEEMFLRRCAELTKQSGYKYFYMVGVSTDDKLKLTHTINSSKYKDYLTEKVKQNQTDSYRYTTKAIIRMGNEKMDGAINAESFLKNYINLENKMYNINDSNWDGYRQVGTIYIIAR